MVAYYFCARAIFQHNVFICNGTYSVNEDKVNSLTCRSGLVLHFLKFVFPFVHVFVLHKKQLSRLTSVLLHSLFQLKKFGVLIKVSLVVVNMAKVKRETNSRETGATANARPLFHSELGYQMSLEEM